MAVEIRVYTKAACDDCGWSGLVEELDQQVTYPQGETCYEDLCPKCSSSNVRLE